MKQNEEQIKYNQATPPLQEETMVKSFLQHVAEDLVAKKGFDLARVAIVFPNKRAALFMNEHFARLSERPMWSPAYMTISDLFRRLSAKQVADPILLVCMLYRVYCEVTGSNETLDHFYGWGQLLLSDFDDLDKNMADADRVLANVRDIRELDDLDYLTPEQKQVIARFFGNFSEDHNSLLKQRFLKMWSRMADIYHAFNAQLSRLGLAYEGSLYREVASHFKQLLSEDSSLTDELMLQHVKEYDCYVFVGFNLLQRVEQQLFTTLKTQGRALFYWDFDHYYLEGNEAGHFIKQYLERFPNELDANRKEIYDCFSQQKRISFVSAPTENIQARYVSNWLRTLLDNKQSSQSYFSDNRAQIRHNTAIVLCNEGLLQTVIHCLPGEVEKVNITTGYPLTQTPAASLVSLLINLQTTGYAPSRGCFRLKQVSAVLRHPYADCISPDAVTLAHDLSEQKVYFPTPQRLSSDEGLAFLFKPQANNTALLSWLCEIVQRVAKNAEMKVKREEDSPLFQESLFRTYTLLNRLLSLCENGDLQVDTITLQRLIGQLISSTSVPFHGEPAEGLQVMGVLETRNLDFDHVLMLSCNEGNMPKGVNDTSFIPYNIRKAYGLTTIDHKVSIYAYYFHRLLQRAKDVTIVYNNATTDGQKAEMSRFMLQLMAESPHHIEMRTLQASISVSPFQPPTIEKTDNVIEQLNKKFQERPVQHLPLLTPTAINSYMRCPLIFYYNYACGLRQLDDNEDDTIDNRVFGNIFHEATQLLYVRLTQQTKQIERKVLDEVLKNKVDIERAVDEAFRTQLFKLHNTPAHYHMELNGMQLINREVIIHYIRQLLEIDRQLAPFTIVGMECDVVAPLKTPHLTTTIGGRIDRLDRIKDKNGIDCLRVIDYKTGNRQTSPLKGIESIFQQESLNKHGDYYLQTLLYACIVRKNRLYNPEQLPVRPALLFIQHAGVENYDPVLKLGRETISDIADYSQQFGELLKEKVAEIFAPNQPFAPTPNRERCDTCTYHLLCSRR